MNVTAKINHQEVLSQAFNGSAVRSVDGQFKASFQELNNKKILKLAELTTDYHIEVKRSGTGMTVIFTPKTS